jgi:hypothetical protein
VEKTSIKVCVGKDKAGQRDIEDALYSTTQGRIKQKDIQEMYRLERSDEWLVVFHCEGDAYLVLDEFNTLHGHSFTTFWPVCPVQEDVLLRRVHWVKHSAYKAFFHIIFAPYGDVLAAWRDNGTSYFNIKLKLKSEMKDRIPHIMRFPKRTGEASDPDRRRLLITIAGRPPICVRRGSHEHIKYKCTAKQSDLLLVRLCESEQEVLRADRERKIGEIAGQEFSPAQQEAARHAKFVERDMAARL